MTLPGTLFHHGQRVNGTNQSLELPCVSVVSNTIQTAKVNVHFRFSSNLTHASHVVTCYAKRENWNPQNGWVGHVTDESQVHGEREVVLLEVGASVSRAVSG